MGEIAAAFRLGGIWMYLILLLTVITLPWMIAQTAMNAFEIRVPTIVWWVGPFLIAIAGAVGLASGLGEAMEAAQNISPEKQQAMLARGISLSLNLAVFTGLVNMVAGGLIALGAGASNLLDPGDDAEYDWIGPVGAGVVAVLGSIVIAGLNVVVFRAGLPGFFPAASLFFGGTGCALAAAIDLDHDTHESAATRRLTAIGGALFSLVFSVVTLMSFGFLEVFQALEHVSAENKSEMLQQGYDMTINAAGGLGGLGLLAVVVIAGILLATAGARIANRTVVTDAIACLIGLILVAAAWGYAMLKIQSAAAFVGDEVEWVSNSKAEAPAHPSRS